MANSEVRLGKVEKILCPTCKVSTHHTIRGCYDSSWSNEEAQIFGNAEHDLMSCNGCEDGTYRITSWFSEESGSNITLLPTRGDQSPNRVPKNFDNLPFGGPLESVYRQTVSAFANKLPTLAGAGVRLLIEGVCKDQGVTRGQVTNDKGVTRTSKDLEGKINGLVEKGFIGKNQAAALHQIRFLGNDAAHELDQPRQAELAIALDIVEHVFTQVYEQPEQAKVLGKRKRPGKE